MEVLKPDATGIYVASHQATAAIEEAIEAEVPLIVAVAEREWLPLAPYPFLSPNPLHSPMVSLLYLVARYPCSCALPATPAIRLQAGTS